MKMHRRDFLSAVPGSLGAASVALAQAQQPTGPAPPPVGNARGGGRGRGPAGPLPPSTVAVAPRKGRIKQGVTAGVFGGLGTLEEQCREAARLGIKGYDLRNTPADWAILKKYGLTPTMYQGPAGGIGRGLNNKANHDEFEKTTLAGIDEAALNGIPNIITFSGGRMEGLSDQEGADNCVAFLSKVKAHAEEKGVTLCMEYLNSKVNHKGYMFDHIAWGVDVMKRVNSPRVKILYDIYHAQIQDGDIVRNIRDHYQWIGHFHTGGNPGRKEIDETQELNYHFIAGAIADLGYQGYISHEYSPTSGHDPIAMLEKAMEICDA
jgi:hydroxypyruvate isomerase